MSSSPRLMNIAIRTARNGAMRELESVAIGADGGLEGDLPVTRDRGVTILACEDWERVIAELGVELPWHSRRANLLVEGLVMKDLVGNELDIAGVRIEILGETAPCELMDRCHAGLRAALEPDFRGGVLGRVLSGGRVSRGDAIEVRALDDRVA